jgi:fermentation-respiration switch protein FrsA (DUF1100 family)
MVRRLVGTVGISLWFVLVVVAVLDLFKAQADGEELFENPPEGWEVERTIRVPWDQMGTFSRRMGVRISRLTNTVLSVEGKSLQVNVIHCRTGDDAEKVYAAVLDEHEGHTAHAARADSAVVEFAKSDDIELMGKVRRGLRLEPVRPDSVTSKLIKAVPTPWYLQDSFVVPAQQVTAIGAKLGGQIKNLSNALFLVNGRQFQVNVFECVTAQDAERIQTSVRQIKGDPALCRRYGQLVVEFVGDRELANEAVRELGIEPTGALVQPEPLAADARAETAAEDEGITGTWLGTLSVGFDLRVVFKISRRPDGILTATIDSPDQGATGIPVDTVSFDKGRLVLESRTIMASYDGQMKDDSLTIEGQWKQASQSLPLVLKRVDKVPEISRPQEPKKPYPYVEEEVVYENKKAGIKLAGTLTLPRSEQPVPAVLLISGSGVQDRNETVFGHRPFLVLADYLTRYGIGVLRVDDRGMGGSEGNIRLFFENTSEDFAQDVLAGIEYLKSRKEIDAKRIGLAGHSEGGVIAPMVAAESPDVAFIVLMAGTGLPGEQVLCLQNELLLKAAGAKNEVLGERRTTLKQIFEVLKQEKYNAVGKDKIRNLLKQNLAKLTDQEKNALAISEELLDPQVEMVVSPWFRFFLSYDPRPALSKVKCPVLAIVGEKDLQVAPKENLHAIEQALKSGGNSNYTVKELPGLNHLFQTAETGAITEYASIDETIAPAALKLITDWIRSIAAPEAGQ